MVETRLVPGDGGYISDESDFYGDEALREELEGIVDRSNSMKPLLQYRKSPTALAVVKDPAPVVKKKEESPRKKVASKSGDEKLYNRYEGDLDAWQLGETIPAFLKRLPPETTSVAHAPWIWIADPHIPPREKRSNVAVFKEVGLQILAELTAKRVALEEASPDAPRGSITRKVTPARKEAVKRILQAAKDRGVCHGKWLLFPYANDVNKIWRKVAEAVNAGEFGDAAKVATDGGNDDPVRVICIYTQDFSDKKDVRRVLEAINDRGLLSKGRAISYKPDAYTHLDLGSKNQWGISPTLYSSKDMVTVTTETSNRVDAAAKPSDNEGWSL